MSLSLFIVNLVPAPFLDGAEIFRAMLQWLQLNSSYESERDLEVNSTSSRPGASTVSEAVWQHRLEIAVAWLSTGLLVIVGLLSLVQTDIPE